MTLIQMTEMQLRNIIGEEIAKALKKYSSTSTQAIGPGMSPTLTVKEVANLVGVVPHTIRTWYRQGKINGTQIGRKILFNRDYILEFIEYRKRIINH